MGFFSKLFKPKYNPKASNYKTATLEDIQSIPVPTQKFEYNCDFTESIEYVLQRKATQFKKERKMDLAIACLQKSNEIMPFAPMTYSSKDYMRYIKYLQTDGQNELADLEEHKLRISHPELFDKRIGNKQHILECVSKCQECKSDLVYLTTNSRCPLCSKYNNKVFSISGKTKKYPKLPNQFIEVGGFDKECSVGICIRFDL